MKELEPLEDLAIILNKNLGNNFINDVIVNKNIDMALLFFDEKIVVIDEAFSEGKSYEINGKKKVKEYFDTLFEKRAEIFRIKSRDIKLFKLSDKFYNIVITLEGFSVEDNKNSIFKLKLGTEFDDNNRPLINCITFYPLEQIALASNKMNGGLISFSLNKSLSIDFISEELLVFLRYAHKGEILGDLDGRFSSAIRHGDEKSLYMAIEESIANKTYFKTTISIKNAMSHYIDVKILGQTLLIEENKYEVFAIISDKSFDLKIETFSNNVSSQMISLAQGYPNPIFWKDRLGNFLGCNIAYLEQFHINSSKDILYHDDSIIFGKETSVRHFEENQRLLSGSETQLTVDESLSVDDEMIYIRVTKIPLHKDGGIRAIIGIVLDVTLQKKFKNSMVQKEAEINNVFALSNHGYFIKDANLKYLKVNQIFCDIVNISMDEIIGKTNDELLVDENFSKSAEQEILKTKEKVTFVYKKVKKNNKKYYKVTENSLLDENGEVLKIIGNVIDITDSIIKEKKLSQDYNRMISVLNEKNTISFITVDLNTSRITSYAQKGSTHNIVGLVYSKDLIKYNASQFLYKNEEQDFLDSYNLDSINMLNKTRNEVKKIYTIKRYDNSLIKVMFSVDFSINPFNSHEEACIKSADITEFQFASEIVNSFDKREYDFIIRLSNLINTFVVVYSDESQYDFKGYEDDNNVDKFLDVLFKNSTSSRPTTKEWESGVKACFEAKSEWNFDIDTKDGRRKNIILRPLNEKKQSVIIVSQDITDRAKHNREIQVKLEKLAKEAVAANNVKTDFLARMSHDMRTPLSAIMGLSDFGISESKDENLTGYFEKIKNSSEYLKTLLNDVLDMQVIENGNLVLNPKKVLRLQKLKNVRTIIAPRALEKNITFTVKKINEGPDYLSVDTQRAEQVLVNILTNAVKYTQCNGQITWTIEYVTGKSFYLHHVISDNGVGMSEEFQKHMFDSFSREENIFSSAEGGSGLGLVIVKNILKVMDGSIQCESTLGKGTTFEINIPVTPISKEEYEKDLAVKGTIDAKLLMNKKILVCEDNKINISIILKILSQYNMFVDIAENGEEGVKLASANNYDAILMDIRMPVMNGLDATKEIRKTNKSIPIIAISANAYKKDIEQSLSYGMNAHLSKPINKNDLFSTLANLLQK